MKDLAIGCDIVEVARIKRLIDNFGEKFLQKIFSVTEIAYCRQKCHAVQSFAVRFAAKEAFSKAVGCGIGEKLSWQDISVISAGAPQLVLSARAQNFLKNIGYSSAKVTLSHTKTLAQAVVVLIK